MNRPLAVFSRCPVTTALFVGPFIVAGSGSRILIFSTKSLKLLCEVNIFTGANVRGLKEIMDTPPPDGSNVKICAFGAKNVHVVQLGPLGMDENAFSVTTLTRAPTFEDWVWDVHGLHKPLIAVALGHNFVALWNWKENIRIHTVHCEDKSILYSACFVGNNWDKLTIFAGTVYKEIVIWYPGYCEQSEGSVKRQPVAQRLTGHDGVVFSVKYDQRQRLLCSTSDDRSVRIWKHMLLDDSDEKILKPNWTFQLVHTLYGHGARVWMVTVVDRYVLSVGEDSNLCVWQHDDGKLIKKVKCHRGSGTWTIAVSNDKEPLVVTGGRDGGLVLWPLSFLVENSTCLDLLPVLDDNDQYPKCVCLLDDDHVVFFTNTSCLWLMNINDRSQKLWFRGDHQDFTCAELRVSKILNIVAVGSTTGDCIILKYDFNSSQPEVIRRHRWKICDGKILSLIWIEEELITVGPEGKTDLWEIVDGEDGLSSRKLCAFLLPPSKQRWLSAATVHMPRHSPNLICGSRDGSLHVFHLTETEHNMQVSPSRSFLRVHGRHGVTCLRCQTRSIFSAGRDGLIRVFQKQNSTFELMRCIRVAGCPEWIADCRWTPQRQLLVLGFHNDRFVIWDDGLQCVRWDVACGGGHRAWDLLFDERCTKATFVYVKEKRIFVSCTDTFNTKPVEITSGLHSREINAVKHIHTFPDGRVLCATGSEDTTVKMWIFKECQQGYLFEIELFCTLHDHISSVKALNVFTGMKCEATCVRKTLFLFGAGGRAQLNCWAIHLPSSNSGSYLIDSSSTTLIYPKCIADDDVECQFMCSHQLHADNLRVKKPWKNPTLSSDPEARYMDMQVWTSSQSPDDLSISVACSDGFVRMFAFCVNSRSIQLLGMFFYKGCCLLRMLRLEVVNCSGVIATTATDGKVAFWNIDQLERACNATTCSPNRKELGIVYDVKLHQSGIDVVAVRRVQENGEEYLVATGGDDGCLVLLQLNITSKDNKLMFSEIWKKQFISAHAAQIEGIDFLDGDRLVSISIDQRLIVWDRDLKPVSCSCAGISDAQTLITWTNRFGECYICNAGEGLQIFKVPNKSELL